MVEYLDKPIALDETLQRVALATEKLANIEHDSYTRVINAEKAATDAQLAAINAKELATLAKESLLMTTAYSELIKTNTDELKEAILQLPDGLAVAALVATNTVNISNLDKDLKLLTERVSNGRNPGFWAGMASIMAPTEKSEKMNYVDEILPAARSVAYAPDLGTIGDGTSSVKVNSNHNFVLQGVRGMPIGGQQMREISRSYINSNDGSADITNDGDICKYTVKNNKTWFDGMYYNKEVVRIGHKAIGFAQIKCVSDINATKNYTFRIQMGMNLLTIATNKWVTLSCISTAQNALCQIVGIHEIGEELWINWKTFTFLDLTLLFPFDQSFVTNLTLNDAPKVLHRLGFQSIDINP